MNKTELFCPVCNWRGDHSDLGVVFFDDDGFEVDEEEITEGQKYNEEIACPDCGYVHIEERNEYQLFKNMRNIGWCRKKIKSLEAEVLALSDVINRKETVREMPQKRVYKKRKKLVKKKDKK